MKQLIKKLSEPKLLLFAGLVYSLFITVSFLMPTNGLPKLHFFMADKVIHVCIHIGLSFLWLLYLYSRNNFSLAIKTILIVILLCVTYGIIIEIIQGSLVDSREADPEDVLANTLGTILGTGIFWKIRTLFRI